MVEGIEINILLVIVTREQIEQELWGDYATASSEQGLNNYIA